jgi:hypothetical protein
VGVAVGRGVGVDDGVGVGVCRGLEAAPTSFTVRDFEPIPEPADPMIESLALYSPSFPGLNDTATVSLCPGPRLDRSGSVIEKGGAAPVIDISSGTSPVLEIVTDRDCALA